ncbi:hypothetical protein C8J55DRAFT_505005 [Lentinula edodes]|uniref:DNA recombination and repair protein Rad51-like C-terminal domain-containing protein n=1 Tax=Lentinula lateritia TaxID=40482 RepID=A0A9W9AU65_9AGAR|nr:hypothetical protein C8J55DRAFT_505005 [Lentinula edodes]
MNFNKMIQEIHSEPLQTLLSTARCEESIPLNIHASEPDALDHSMRQGMPSNFPRLGDVLEIQGPPASGKSHLLYLLMIICIIPTTYASTSLGGWGKVTILYDTGATFDLARFKQLLTSHLATALKNKDSNDIQILVKRSLQNLHIFRPCSSIQLAATLFRLPSYHQINLPDSEIGILAIDSMSAFCWADRFTAEQLRATPTSRVNESHNPLKHVIVALQRFHHTHKPLIVFTNWDLTPEVIEDERGSFSYRQHLNPPPALFPAVEVSATSGDSFANALPLTFHITLSMAKVPQFPVDLSFTDTSSQRSFASRQITGIIRSARSSQASKITFNIEADHMDLPIVLS